MLKRMLRICSMVLTIVLVINLLPAQALGEMVFTEKQTISATDESLSADATVTNSTTSAEIVEEIEENRTEYTKEFKLSNGMHMAVVYGDPVHYDNNGQWDEIDNTLKTTTKGTLTNTAGVWDVSLPQQLNGSNPVTITKDGYTLSFVLAGELNKPSDAVVMSEQAELSSQAVATETEAAQPYAIASAQSARAQIVDLDYEAYKAEAEYEETVIEKRQSRLLYANVYSATNITYDLDSNRVKESVILKQYNANLRGYKYTLDVGTMVPVLGEDGHIDFYNEDKTEIVMVMPAPFLIDADNVYNDDIQVQLVGEGSSYSLTYILPQSWLADESRQWPVVLDPEVRPSLSTGNIRDQQITENTEYSNTRQVMEAGRGRNDGIERFYVKYRDLPALGPSDVIVDAEIRLKKIGGYSAPLVEVHKVLETWESETLHWSNKKAYDPLVEDYGTLVDSSWYSWDITDIARGWYEGENTGMMFKASDAVEQGTAVKWRQFISSDGGGSADRPTLTITFRNNNGLESYWSYTSASAGRAGTGYVNDYTGNLVWTRGDLGFSGNRFPVAISHTYNANDTVVADSSNNSMATSGNAFGMGYGWRTNYNQVVYQWSTDSSYYVWEDADGTDHYFEYSGTTGKYIDEDGLEMVLTVTGSGYTITDKGGNVSYFDSNGRFYKQENNQATKSSVNVYYTTDTGKLIDYITDGVGRKYDFIYTDDMLTRISYLGSAAYQTAHADQADREISYVAYAYDSNNNLTSVTDKDGKSSTYTYTENGHLLASAQDIDGYMLSYTYTQHNSGKPSRIKTVTESHNGVLGSELTLSYGHNQTTFTDHNGNKEICQFNDYGNTISIQDGLGRAQHADFTFNSAADVSAATAAGNTSAKSNQLALSSKLQNTVKNYFVDQSFENGDAWDGGTISMAYSYMGAKSMYTTGNAAIDMFDVAPDESVTFSAYVKTIDGTAFINIGDSWADHPGSTVEANTDWTRVEINYTNDTGETQQIYAEFTASGESGAYIDCVQLEKMPTASRYNLIDNGDFSNNLNGWTGSDFTLTTATSGAPQLDNNMVTVTGDPSATRQLTQTVKVSGEEGDTFVLAGWAKGDSVPLSGTRTFGIIGTFNYTDGTTGDFTASFNPDTNDTVIWQYTAEPMVAKKAYNSITVKLAYDKNANSVCFDGIQLFKETFGESYTYDENGNIISVVDLQQQETTHEYSDNNLTETMLPSGAKMSYTYDAYHNVKTATSAEGQVYSFSYDTYGNNTSVSISMQDGTEIISSAAYSENGNCLVSNTDALGKTTTYEYDPETNMVLSVQYPEDDEDTKTEYTYDGMYNLASAVATATDRTQINADLQLSATYGYTNDLLTSIQKPSTMYTFTYGNFGLMTEMRVGTDRTLASYEYTTDGNNYLKAIDYDNGGKVEYSYDSYGRVQSETYDQKDTVTYHYDNDGALAAVSDSQSGITTRYYYDFSGRSVGYKEAGPGFSHSVGYEYDSTNNLEQLVETIDGVKHTTSYKYDKDNRVTSITADGVTVEYTYDPLGRTTQQVTKKDSSTILTEYFTYKEEDYKTSTQVWKYRVQSENADFLYEYTYDDNGNITRIVETDNETGSIFTTNYTYDTANQLVREDNQRREESYTWTYDNAGNITHYKSYPYTTGSLGTPTTVEYEYKDDKGWGDLLTAWGGKEIEYDAVGNPTLIGDKDDPAASGNQTFVWEHGSRLASMTKDGVTWDYSYNNAGLRTSRTNDDITYKYVYDGDKLSQMTIIDKENDGEQTNKQVVNFTYNAAGAPLTMTYDGQTYYYTTNMQGDVTGLLDNLGQAVITYSYSAYGLYAYEAGSDTALAETLSKINPLGYRGYLLDVETGMYYLQSRYYDPTMGRFLNPDSVMADADGDLLGYNLFAYCKNNPIRYSDSEGNWPNWAKKMVAAVAVVAVVAAVAAITVATAGTGTAVACAAMGAAQGAAVGALTGAVSGAVEGAVTHRIKTGSWSGAGQAALEGAADGALSGAIEGAISGGMNSPYCFVAGTLIWTELGTAPIETIVAGDMVWAWDEKTGDVALKEVVETYINETDELVHIYVNGEKITTTPSHPFYSPVKGWTDATRLRAGDILVLVNGEYVVVEKVQHELLECPIAVYNFQVEDYHTYYVSDSGVLVHNSCHGNSLKTTKKAELYVLRDNKTGVVKKIGETTRGTRRYTQKFYNEKDVYMQIIDSGSKKSMHFQQHRLLEKYYKHAGKLPELNKSLW